MIMMEQQEFTSSYAPNDKLKSSLWSSLNMVVVQWILISSHPSYIEQGKWQLASRRNGGWVQEVKQRERTLKRREGYEGEECEVCSMIEKQDCITSRGRIGTEGISFF